MSAITISHSPERYLRTPRWRAGAAGEPPSLCLIAWEIPRDQERILVFPIASIAPLALGEAQEGALQEAICAIEGGAAAAASAEQRARDGADSVRIECAHGIAHVIATIGGRDHRVWRARGSASSPAIASCEDGVWIAWHHDVREDTLTPDVAKWIALRFVDRRSGQVFEVDAIDPARDRDLMGEEQSFEFPSVVIGDAGAVTILGRGSHCFWRQDIDHGGFSARTPISGGEWGSRGRFVVGTKHRGALLSACRERQGILIQTHPLASGARPPLRLAAVDLTSQAPAILSERRHDLSEVIGRQICFGDLQQHSAHSDGVGSADEVYLRARYRYHDEFVALTDHESFLGKRTGPGEWEYLQQVADAHNEEGAFVSVLAYEWTGRRYPGPGHKCVYLRERGVPIISRDTYPEGRDAVQAIAAQGAIAAPHHVGWTGCDEAGHDPIGQPVWEICSCHGCYEHPDHPLGARGDLQDQCLLPMLEKGHRFGFTGSSDSHGLLWHHGESRKRDPYRTGLTGMALARLDRASIFDALSARACFATSGAKIQLEARADGHPMGSLLHARGAEIRGSAIGESDIHAIQIMGPGGVLHEARGEGRRAEICVSLEDQPFAYLRVIQRDGEMAWASPFFFEAPGE